MRSTGFGHRTHYLHGYHGVVPPMALIALFARVTRSTNRSTLTTAIAGYQLQNVTADRGPCEANRYARAACALGDFGIGTETRSA